VHPVRKVLKIIIGTIVLFIVVAVGAIFTFVSLTEDMESLGNQNMLILIVDETNKNEVEMGFGMMTEGGEMGPKMVDVGTEVQGGTLREVFTSGSFKSNCNSLLDQSISIVGVSDEGVKTSSVKRFQRVIVIPTSYFGKIADLTDGVDIGFGDEDEMQITKHLTGNEALKILRSDDLSGTGEWTLKTLNPITGEEITTEVDEKEFLNTLLSLPFIKNEEQGMTMVKMMVSMGVMGSAGKIDDPSIKTEMGMSLIEDYKKGDVRVCPSTAVTKLVKAVPSSVIRGMVGQEK
jgi:hypothetical protein